MNTVATIVCVVDAAQTDEVLFGPQGAAAVLQPGQAVLLCPTIAPLDVERLARQLAERGVDAIDAPMSGGPARARDGSMSLMVACPDPVFERCRRLIETLSSQVFRISARPGDGARTKLVNNLLAGAITMIFFTYAFVNMGMVSGILPVVGVPLPFISYGGTAMVTLGLALGILMSISRARRLMQT